MIILLFYILFYLLSIGFVLFSFASNEMDSNEIKLNRLKERKWAN
jgi:hypothetical protein